MTRYLFLLPLAALALILSQSPALAKLGFSGFAPALGLKIDVALPAETPLAFDTRPHGALASLQRAPLFAGSLGFRLPSHSTLSLGAESLSRQKTLDFASGENGGFADTQLGLINLRYEPEVSGKLKPFALVGAGLAYHDGIVTDSAGFTTGQGSASTGFAWQLGGGLEYRADDNLSFTGSYRFLNAQSLGFDKGAMDFNDHEIWLGVKYALPYD